MNGAHEADGVNERRVEGATAAQVPARPRERRGLIAVLALAALLWLPRLGGPIDLRYDAGVYYLLGTSLAAGDGYRIPSEPGAPEAIQYPPLLPTIVAAHQLALGTADADVVAPWLRRTYALTFMAYAAVVWLLARRVLAPAPALLASALCLCHVFTYYLSDLLFTELPFALVCVVFLLALERRPTWRRELGLAALAAAAFLLRTAGVALLAAWVGDALLRRRWRAAALRAALAIVPVALWQAHVASVQASAEYSAPAYEYQRASYQYYNVSYAENALLVDPFQPELGRADAPQLARRVLTNLACMPAGLGEAVSLPESHWRWALTRPQQLVFGDALVPPAISPLAILALGLLALGGLVALAARGEWAIGAFAAASIALVCATPWPGQFSRYLAPLSPVLTIAATLSIVRVHGWLRARRASESARVRQASHVGAAALVGVVALALGVQAYTVFRSFRYRALEGAIFVPGRGAVGPRVFYYEPGWASWERAVAFVAARAEADDVVVTSAPHLAYLRTGLRAVLPPMEPDPAAARRLIEGVPASFVIVDELDFLDIGRRYALPAMERAPGWRLALEDGRTRVYQRAAGPAK